MTASRIDGAPIVASAFDAYSRMDSQKVTGDPVRTYFTYDVLDRLSKTTYNGNEKRYYYAADGTLAQTTDTLSDPSVLPLVSFSICLDAYEGFRVNGRSCPTCFF